MKAEMSNGALRELIAERDYLRARNTNLSESLDDTAAHYIGILERLGFDKDGNPIPKEPAPIGEPAEDSGEMVPDAAPAEDDDFVPRAPKVKD